MADEKQKDFEAELEFQIIAEQKKVFRKRNDQAMSGRPGIAQPMVFLSAADFIDESFFEKLDASIKKNSSFIKRLKQITADQRPALVAEFSQLKMTKYISEAVASIVENKLKQTGDILAAVEVPKYSQCQCP